MWMHHHLLLLCVSKELSGCVTLAGCRLRRPGEHVGCVWCSVEGFRPSAMRRPVLFDHQENPSSRKSFGPFLLALLLLSHLQYNPPGSVPIFFLYPVQLTFEVHHVSVSIIPPSVESKKSRIRLLHRGVETPV